MTALLVIMTVIGGATWLVLGQEPGSGVVARANVVGGAAALAAIVLALAALRWKPRQPAWLIPEEQLSAACEYLARETHSYWFEQSRTRGIGAPIPAAVRWKWSDPSVAAPVVDIAGHASQAFSEGVVTELGDQLYDALPTEGGRLVIAGAAGSGKTATMLLLLLHVLGRRRDRPQPTPVWLTLGSWNPRTPVADWVVGQLVRDYPGIELAEWPAKVVAREMYERGRVALFMDGLDEMPAPYRPRALAQLNQVDHLRFVVTSRPAELEAAISKSRVFGASVVETLPLTPSAAGDFLLREQLSARRAMWQQVVTHVTENPDCALATAFRTPLALSLAREIYMSSADPRELLDPISLPTSEAVMDFLLERFLHLAYPNARERDRAVKVLRWAAIRMSPTRDLAWWKIAAIPGLGGLPRRFTRRRRTSDRPARLDSLPSPPGADATAPTPSRRRVTIEVIQARRLRTIAVLIPMVGVIFAIRLVYFYADRRAILIRFGEEPADNGAGNIILLLTLATLVGAVSGRALSYMGSSIGGAEDQLPATTPAESYASERRFAAGGAGLILLFGLPLIAFVGPVPVAAGVTAAALIFLAGPALALFLLDLSMPLRALGHVRLMPFLEDALKRQVLRQVGPIYQFRHASIQDYLIRSAPGTWRPSFGRNRNESESEWNNPIWPSPRRHSSCAGERRK